MESNSPMLSVHVNDEQILALMNKAIQERVDELAKQKYFITYSELSDYLNISKPIIEERLIKNGMKHYKIGNKYLFKRSEVDAFLDEMTESMDLTNNDIKFFKKINKKKAD